MSWAGADAGFWPRVGALSRRVNHCPDLDRRCSWSAVCGTGAPTTNVGIGRRRGDVYWPYAQSPHRRVRGRHLCFGGSQCRSRGGAFRRGQRCAVLFTVQCEYTAMRTAGGSPVHLRRQRRLWSAVVSRFGDVSDTGLGHECLPHLLLRSRGAADQTGDDSGATSRSAAAPASAMHSVHQLLARPLIRPRPR